MKKVRSWNAMSSMGVTGISRLCSDLRLRPRVRLKGAAPRGRSFGVHRLQGELAEPPGLARRDQAEQRRERRVAVGPEDDRRGQVLGRVELDARRPQPELHELSLVADLLHRL